MKANDVPAEI